MYADAAKAPDCGAGPYSIQRSADDDFYYVVRAGLRVAGRGPYPLGKTAAKACRQLNSAHVAVMGTAEPGVVVGLDLSGTVEDVMARYPDPPKHPSRQETPEEIERANERARELWGDKPREAGKHPALGMPYTPPVKVPRKRTPKAKPVKHGAAAEPSITASFTGTREQWLNAFVIAARPAFKQRGHELPERVRVSIGFTGARGGGKVLGACWHEEASTDSTREIFVVPTLDDSSLIAGVLTHELCHTLFGPDEKHGRNFKAAGAAVGLVGKATSMLPPQDGEKNGWHEWADPILADLGPIPHAKLDPSKSGVKKQTTRLLKAECPACGFTTRVTAKWVNSLSERGLLPMCPDPECVSDDKEADDSEGGYHSRMVVELPEDEEG